MNNDKLKMLKQELRISGKDLITVNIVKPAAFFFSEGYTVKNEGAEGKLNRKMINRRAQQSIDCYGITNAGLVMEALIIDRPYEHGEAWEVIAFTDHIDMCPLNPVGSLKKKREPMDGKFEYNGEL